MTAGHVSALRRQHRQRPPTSVLAATPAAPPFREGNFDRTFRPPSAKMRWCVLSCHFGHVPPFGQGASDRSPQRKLVASGRVRPHTVDRLVRTDRSPERRMRQPGVRRPVGHAIRRGQASSRDSRHIQMSILTLANEIASECPQSAAQYPLIADARVGTALLSRL